MTANFEQAGVRFVLVDLQTYLAGTARAQQATNGMADSFVKAGDKASKSAAGINTMGRSLGTVGQIAGGTLLAQGISKLASLGVGAIKAGLGFDSLKEQATIAFTTILGSAEKAEAFIQQLTDFAARTPFEMPGLLTATQRLLAYGFAAKDVIPTLTAIGDASAGLSAGQAGIDSIVRALGQMRNAGRVNAQDMNQLIQVGVPAWSYLAAAVGKTVAETRDLAEKNKLGISSGKAVQIILQGLNKDFGGLMDKQSKSVAGLGSTIHDTFQQLAGTVLKPFFGQIQSGFTGLVEVMTDPRVARGAEAVAAAITRMMEGIGSFLDLMGIGAGEVALFAGVLVTGLAAGFAIMGAAAAAAFIAANAALFGIPLLLAAVSVAILLAIKHWDELKDAVNGVWESIPGPIRTFLAFLTGTVLAQINGFVNSVVHFFTAIEKGFEVIADVISGDWAEAWDDLKAMASEGAKGLVASILAPLALLPNLLIENVFQPIADAWDSVADKIAGNVKVPLLGNVNPLAGQDLKIGKLPTVDTSSVLGGADLGGVGGKLKGLFSSLTDIGGAADKSKVSLDDGKESFDENGEAAEKAGKKVDVLKDHIIDFDEALSHGLTAAQAGAIEAIDQLADAQHQADAEAFNFTKTLVKVAAAFQQSAAGAQKMVLDLARSAQTALSSAVSAVFAKPTREVANLQLQLAKANFEKLNVAGIFQPMLDQLQNRARDIERASAERLKQIDRQAQERIKQIDSTTKAQVKQMEGQIDRLQKEAQAQEAAMRSARTSAVVNQINALRESFENRVLNAAEIADRDRQMALLEAALEAAKSGAIETPAGGEAEDLKKRQEDLQENADKEKQAIQDKADAEKEAEEKKAAAEKAAVEAEQVRVQKAIDQENAKSEAIQHQIDLLTAQSEIWQKQIQAADKTLLTQAEQGMKAAELAQMTAEASGQIRTLSEQLGMDIIPEMDAAREAMSLLRESARVLSDDSLRQSLIPNFDAASARAALLAEAEGIAEAAFQRAGLAADGMAEKLDAGGTKAKEAIEKSGAEITEAVVNMIKSIKPGAGGGGGDGAAWDDGGFVRQPTFGVVAEQGRPEVVLPLTKPARSRELLAAIPSGIAASIFGPPQRSAPESIFGSLNVSGATLEQMEATAHRAMTQAFRQARATSMRNGGNLSTAGVPH